MSGDVLVDGVAADALPADDRGTRYCDGVFETLRVRGGESVWWDAHLERMACGAQVLGIAMPDASVWRSDLAHALAGRREALVRLTLTRGSGGHGYAPPAQSHPRRIVAVHPLPVRRDAVSAIWCATLAASQPQLAGIKHLNRLPNVLAAREVAAAGVDEGLMCDDAGHAIGGVATNLFVERDGALSTPPLDRCGVAGTCRRWILDNADVRVRAVSRGEVESADALFLCNSVRGILPVRRLAGREYGVGPRTAALMLALSRAEPAFAMPTDGGS